MASAYTLNIFVVNNDPTCSATTIQSQITTTACSETYLVKISSQSNALGPFAVYSGSTGTTAIYSAATRTQMVAGLPIIIYNDDPVCVTTPTPTISVTPTITPTVTPTETPTPTPTPTITQTPGASVTPTPTVTNTQTPTPSITPTITPSSTPATEYAYLFIEPQSGNTAIGQYMYDLDNTRTFFGFTNSSVPNTSNSSDFNVDMNDYVSFSGWTGGTFPAVQSESVPQTSGGVDSFGNAITAYNFKTHQVPANSIGNPAWYTWIIPTGSTNGLEQIHIDFNVNGNPNSMNTVITDSTIRNYTFTYTGATIPADTYRVYTTFADLAFYITDNDNIYFKGNTVA